MGIMELREAILQEGQNLDIFRVSKLNNKKIIQNVVDFVLP